MANYQKSFELTFEREGGYVNHPNDRGGETLFGISRRYHPDWVGWKTVDMVKPYCTEEEGTKEYERELTSYLKSNEVIVKQKLEFYKDRFWNPLLLDEIKDQDVANAIFDAAVNHDPRDAAKMAQKCLDVIIDGIMGTITIDALNLKNKTQFLRDFTKTRIQYYKKIVERNPNQKVFLDGWIRRAQSFNV